MLGALGHDVVELRVASGAEPLLSFLRSRGVIGEGAFLVGSTLTLPLRGTPTRDVFAAVDDFGAVVVASTARPPTLDDVYLNLTGSSLVAAA